MVDRVKAHQASELVAVTVMQLESKFKLTKHESKIQRDRLRRDRSGRVAQWQGSTTLSLVTSRALRLFLLLLGVLPLAANLLRLLLLAQPQCGRFINH